MKTSPENSEYRGICAPWGPDGVFMEVQVLGPTNGGIEVWVKRTSYEIKTYRAGRRHILDPRVKIGRLPKDYSLDNYRLRFYNTKALKETYGS